MWIAPFHGGRATRNSNHVFNRLKTKDIKYETIQDIINQSGTLKVPDKIFVDVSEKYPFIEDFKFEEVEIA